MLIYYICYCKCRFEMAVMCLILQETPWKIWMQNLHFWLQNLIFSSDIWGKSWKFYFCMYSTIMHANMPLTFSTPAESHLKMLIYNISRLQMKIWNGCNAFNITGNPVKDINAKLTLCMSSASDIWPFSSDIWWKYFKFHFCMYSPMMHADLP